MNITNERHNLLRLWLESFSVVNRCTGKLFGLILISLILVVLASLVVVFAAGSASVLSKLQAGFSPVTLGAGAALTIFAFAIGSNLYTMFFFNVCCQIMAAEVQNQKQPFFESFSGSILPTVYQIITSILLAIPYFIFIVIVRFINQPVITLVAFLALFLLVGVRLCYTFIAIAVDNKGPIEGLMHSWKLSSGKGYLDALLMCVMCFLSVLLIELFYIAIAYGLYILIPLYFAQSFNANHIGIGWWLFGAVLVLIGLFFTFVLLAFPVLVYLNRNAVTFDARMPNQLPNEFIPVPDVELPTETVDSAELTATTLPPGKMPQGQEMQPQTEQQPKQAPKMSGLDGLQVSRSSINATEEDTNNISQHLDQVYTPKKENVVQQGDEDRMPTILFDDELAKQLLSKPEEAVAPKDNPEPPEEDAGTIKMSK